MRSLAGVLALLILGGPAAAEQDAGQVDSMNHMKHMEHTPEMMKGPADGIPIAVLLYEGALLLDYGIAAEMFQAANGILLFGWSAALIFAFIHRLATQDEALAARLESTG